MKKMIIVAVISMAAYAMAFGQASYVSLQNQENATFYYVVDPKELGGLSAGSPLLSSRIAEFFAARSDDPAFASLAPDASVRLDGLADGAHLLVGFFAVEDLNDFPVRVISLQADSRVGERFYAIFASPALLTVTRGSGRLARFARGAAQPTATVPAVQPAATSAAAQAGQVGATVPTTASDAKLQAIASFSPAFTPAFFTRERGGEFSVLPIADSRAWADTGTRIAALSGSRLGGELRLSLSVPGGFSEGVSYFFYVFGNRSLGKDNLITLEVQPRTAGRRAVCLLWRNGVSMPKILGSVRSTDSTVELDTGTDPVAAGLLAGLGESATVDLTAGWFNKAQGTWEEFYYTTFSLGDIAVIR
jgi:hypothetical protein